MFSFESGKPLPCTIVRGNDVQDQAFKNPKEYILLTDRVNEDGIFTLHVLHDSKIGWLVHPQNMSNQIDTVTPSIQVQICFLEGPSLTTSTFLYQIILYLALTGKINH